MSEVVDILRENDINADDYVRGPFGRNIFAISVRPNTAEGQIRIWPGLAKFEVYPDKKKRQAVIFVDETNREISRKINARGFQSKVRARAIRDFRNRVALPREATFKTGTPRLKREEKTWRANEEAFGTFEIDVTAKLPRTSQNLLVGMDETYHFIAALPKRVKSVDEAHEALRPHGLPKGTVRQGEWFFTPVDEETEARLEDIVTMNPQRVTRRNFGGTGHYGMQVIVRDDEQFATGYVFDERGSIHHRSLFLPSWYKVVKNREVVVARESGAARRMRRTWD